MPQYSYYCEACQKDFTKIMTLREYEQSRVVCPHCGSGKVEQRWSAFFAVTSKKS